MTLLTIQSIDSQRQRHYYKSRSALFAKTNLQWQVILRNHILLQMTALSNLQRYAICAVVLGIGTLLYRKIERWDRHRKIRADQVKRYHLDKRTKLKYIRETIGGISTEIYNVQMVSNTPISGKRLVYIMVPGNPGIASCYIHWFRILVSLFMDSSNSKYQSITCYMISHANHCCDPFNMNGGRVFLTNDQMKHKRDAIQFIIDSEDREHSECDYVIGGHSIGAFVILKLMKSFKTDQFKQIHLWAPTIVNIGDSPKGRQTAWILDHGGTRLMPLIHLVVTRLLPRRFVKFVLLGGGVYNEDKVVENVTCEHSRTLCNILTMARDEFIKCASLEQTGMDRILRENAKKLVFYWAETDGWAHPQCREDIKVLFGKSKDEEMKSALFEWIVDPNLKHAIMVDDPEKNVEHRLSEMMLKWIHYAS